MLINRSREDYLSLVIIVLAIGGDIAAFYVVLARVFRGSPLLILLGTVGFAAAAVGLAHLVGQGLARRRCGDPRASVSLTVASGLVWLILGAAAFVTRLLTPSGSSAGGGWGVLRGRVRVVLRRWLRLGWLRRLRRHVLGHRPLAALPAVLFGALFLASGVAAMVATFLSFNPVAGALRRAEKRMQQATDAERVSRAELERAREALRQQENEREREDQRWRAAPSRSSPRCSSCRTTPAP